jgi:hypothetical protein
VSRHADSLLQHGIDQLGGNHGGQIVVAKGVQAERHSEVSYRCNDGVYILLLYAGSVNMYLGKSTARRVDQGLFLAAGPMDQDEGRGVTRYCRRHDGVC